MTKICNKCGIERQLAEYQTDDRNKDGKQGICSICKNDDKARRRELRIQAQSYSSVITKACNKCGASKQATDFYKDKAMKDGLSSICKVCKAESVYKWREENKDKYNQDQRAYMKAMDPEKRYGHEIKRRYGCTLEQYNAMLMAQAAKCAICGCQHNPAEKKGRLFVDHCHKTGKVRALLCSGCNSMLGYSFDSINVLQAAIDYLQKHKIS